MKAHACVRLTVKRMLSIIIFTHKRFYAQETASRPQVPGAPATGMPESSSRTGLRRTVSDPRVFRCARPRSGQVRNAAPGRDRRTAGEPISSRFWVFPALFLPSADEFPTGRPTGADAAKAGAQASSQAQRRGARIYPQARQQDPSLRPAVLASRIQDRYGITVHSRSIERALARSQKKPR